MSQRSQAKCYFCPAKCGSSSQIFGVLSELKSQTYKHQWRSVHSVSMEPQRFYTLSVSCLQPVCLTAECRPVSAWFSIDVLHYCAFNFSKRTVDAGLADANSWNCWWLGGRRNFWFYDPNPLTFVFWSQNLWLETTIKSPNFPSLWYESPTLWDEYKLVLWLLFDYQLIPQFFS